MPRIWNKKEAPTKKHNNPALRGYLIKGGANKNLRNKWLCVNVRCVFFHNKGEES